MRMIRTASEGSWYPSVNAREAAENPAGPPPGKSLVDPANELWEAEKKKKGPKEWHRWDLGAAEAYSYGVEDAKAGRPSRAGEYQFRAAYEQGYSHGRNREASVRTGQSPDPSYRLLRDGEDVMVGTEQEIWSWLHRNHSYSVGHALKYEGYSIKPVMSIDTAETIAMKTIQISTSDFPQVASALAKKGLFLARTAQEEPDEDVWLVESGTFRPGLTWAVPSGWYHRRLDGGDPIGPFKTEEEAEESLEYARRSMAQAQTGSVKVVDFQVEDHGFDNPQYFTGGGTSGTKWTYSAIGVGDNPAEALNDALEFLAQGTDDIDFNDLESRIKAEYGEFPETPSASDDLRETLKDEGHSDEDLEEVMAEADWYYYVVVYVQLPGTNTDASMQKLAGMLFYESVIRPASGGFGEWTVDESDEGWDDKRDLLDAIRESVVGAGGQVFELGSDDLPEGVQDIRGSIHNEPEVVLAIVHSDGQVTYLGVRGHEIKREAAKLSEDAQDFISGKIKKLIGEGYEQDRAQAVAYSMARERGFSVPEKS